jgi:PKD repeat protein
VVVRDTPHFDFNIPATACEGYETVVATAYEGTGDSVYYSFEVTEVLDTATINNQIENPGEVYSQTFYGLVPDSFRFEGYYFRGGRKYNISLSITNNCGTSTQEKILEIPLGAYIKMERSTLYANPIHGARSVQLHGYVSPIDSFRWEPLTWLNRGDTLVVTSTPQDSIAYILMAFKDECIAYDTAIIRVRHVANAGVGDTICYNHGKVLLGNAYDMSVFLGYLYFKGGMDFRNMYTTKTSLDETYFQYFSLYMQSQGFKDWANSCANLYEDFTELLHREQTIHQNWYISYFENLTAFDHPLMYPLDTFVYYVSNDSALNSNYTSVNDWGNLGGCIDEMFVNYEEFKQNQLSSINISWYRITDTDTSYTSSIQESSIAIDEPTITSSYIQTVITESYAEIDQTIVWMDTMVTAAFGVQFQFDSTVIFENFTLPETAGNSYSWNFGDGSAVSTDKNALHEFPKFDTSYLVCLSVTNNCGTSMFCDTVYIDSAHWGGSLRATDKKPIHTTLANSGSNLMRAVFYPNPVESFGILSYEFEPDENSGEIQITDSQGKLVYSKNLSQQKEQIFIPTTHLAPGMYFYVLSCRNGETLQGKFIK